MFLGAAVVQAALAGGHRVTELNRGRARSAWPAGVEVLTGDRSADLTALDGRHWHAVIDTCGYAPADVRASAGGAYLFVSSISAYATTNQVAIAEADALASFDGIAADDRDLRHYGPQKAACEAEVTRVFGDWALIVRPGLIVGPGDRSGRFSHWPWRLAAGGAVLVPDVPAGEPLQYIDVRDLADWMLRLLEQGARGTFNATGPAGGMAADWQALIDACCDEALARGLTPATAVRVGEAFLLERAVAPWSELPLWLPSTDPDFAGFNRVDLARADSRGLRTRPLAASVAAVLDEGLPASDDKRRVGKLTREREAQLLLDWATAARPGAAS